MILDDAGELVWFHPLDTEGVTDFRAQRYDGRPVLTWWRGKSEQGVGDGHYVIVDDAYREIATVSAGNGLDRRHPRVPDHATRHGSDHDLQPSSRPTCRRSAARRTGPSSRGSSRSSISAPAASSSSGTVRPRSRSTSRTRRCRAPRRGRRRMPTTTSTSTRSTRTTTATSSSLRGTRTPSTRSRAHDRKVMWRLGGKRSDYAMGAGRALRLAARRSAPGGRDADALRQRLGRRGGEGALVARGRAAARRRRAAGDARAFVRASQRAAGDDPGQRPVPGRRSRVRRVGRAARTSPSSTAAAASSSTAVSASRAPTPTAPTASRGAAGRPTIRRSRSNAVRRAATSRT